MCQSEGSAPSTSSSKEDEFKSGDFFGVYLLLTLNPKYKERTYIGFTVDPERRIKQHNRGAAFGGASKTSNRGPWEMILIVHGFPNMISALRFEWAWQHPKVSRRLNKVPKKKSNERMFGYNIRLLSEMLNVGPWNRLPLTVRWLKPEIKFAEFPNDRKPPAHIPIVFGPLKLDKRKKKDPQLDGSEGDDGDLICSLCIENVIRLERLQCVSNRCGAIFHLHCLAQRFRQESDDSDKFLPVQGTCPVCDVKTLWGDIVRNCLQWQNNPD